jgi:hypothetical protein
MMSALLESKLIERKAYGIAMINPIGWSESAEGQAQNYTNWAQAMEAMRATARQHGYKAMYDQETTQQRDEVNKVEYTHLKVYNVGLVPVKGTEETNA